MSIARDLAWQKHDKEMVREAKRAILDSLGCAIGGHRAPARPICEAAVREMGGSADSTVFRVRTPH